METSNTAEKTAVGEALLCRKLRGVWENVVIVYINVNVSLNNNARSPSEYSQD
jgi:hypothetical protein